MDFDMGKYGLYVWGAYGLSALSLVGLVLLSVQAHRQSKKALEALNASLEKRDAPGLDASPETVEGQRLVAKDVVKDAGQ